MTQFRYFLLALAAAFVPTVYANVNPDPGSPPSKKKKCSDDGSPAYGSIDWSVEVGLASTSKPGNFTGYAQLANEKDGSLANFADLRERSFSNDPLQEHQVNVEFSQSQIGAATFHPSALAIHSDAEFEKLMKPSAGGFPEFIHQILTIDCFTLIDLLPYPDSGWRLRTWRRDAAALTKSGSYYVTSSFATKTPLKDVIVRRPAGSSGNNDLIYIQKESTGVSGTRVVTEQTSQSLDVSGKPASVVARLYSGEGTTGPLLSEEILAYSERGARVWDYTITRQIYTSSMDAAGTNGALTLTAKTREDYADFSMTAAGGELGMKRLVSKTEAYAIAGQTPQTTSFNYIQSPTNPATHGRLLSSVKPDGSWVYNDYTISVSNPVSVIAEYSSWKNLSIAQRASARRKVTTVTANESISESYVANQLVARSRNTLTAGIAETITTSEQWDGAAWHVTTTAYYLDTAAAPSTGRLKWIEDSSGTATTTSYATVGGNLVTTTRTGAGSRSGITAGTEVKVTYGLGNFPVAQVTKDIASALVVERWDTDLTFNGGLDPMGRPIKRMFNGDVNDYDVTQYACCGLEFTRDRMGATTTYFRDGLKRVYKIETKATAAPATPVVATFNTISGLTTTQTRRYGGSGALFIGSATRSVDGLSTTKTGPSLKSSLATDRPVTSSVTTHSGSGDTVFTTRADTSTSVTDYYLDGRTKSVSGTAVPDIAYDYATHEENGGGEKTVRNASGLVTSEFTDLIGRTRKMVSGSTGTTTYTYHAQSAAAGSRGNLQSVTDGDNVTVSYGYNGKGDQITESRTIPLASGTATQVTTNINDVVSTVTLHGVALGISSRQTQSIASTGVSAVTTSRSYSAINGLVSGSSILGRQSLAVKTRANATTGIATHTHTNSDSTRSVQTTTHGLTTSVQNLSSTGLVITGISYTHDSFQRPDTMTDLRTGTTSYGGFTEAGQPLTVTTNGNTDVTTTVNDIIGRIIKTVLPDGTVKHTAYLPTGQIKVAWGSQTYPAWNVYDEQGRQTQLHTWKAAPTFDPAAIPASPPAGSEVTTWAHGPTTGRLDRKQYADTKGTDYLYTAAGRLQTRTWARGVSTTYGYTQGLMTSTTYSDSTPGIAIVYDPLGRQSTVTQTNQSQTAYTYDPVNLAVDTETIKYDLDYNGSYEFIRVLDRRALDLDREKGWELKNGTIVENQATYGYHATEGRLLNVMGGGNIPTPETFTYGYTPNSNLIQTVTGPVHTVTNTWEANRDVLDIKQNKVGTDIISKYDYFVNPIGQRTEVATSGTAFPATPSWLWGYDSLGQVIAANSSVNTSDRAFEYDAIGNRKKSANSLTLPISDNYVANSLNQYTAGTTATAVPAYDSDGNATAYPLPVAPTTNSALVWDAENRMISSIVGTTSTTYLYDAQSRRIAVTSGGTTTLSVYDGWNCIAEYTGTALPKTRLWGTDLSGSMQGAGGVGGLLAERHTSGTAATYHPTYDGNGNVRGCLKNI